jgi:glycerol-3-phosphate acyltransferase PlsY
VATGLGAFLCVAPLAVACVALVFVAVVAATRYVSLGSIIAAVLLPLFVWLLYARTDAGASFRPVVACALIGGALIIYTHRANISRLARGEENKLKL